MKRFCFASLVVAGLLGFICISMVRAADFTAWTAIWFKMNVNETGFRAVVLPTGGPLVKNNERNVPAFLEFTSCDDTAQTCTVNVCTFDPPTALWNLQTGVSIPILSGQPLDFLTLFEFSFRESTGIIYDFVIPLHVKGKTTASKPNTLKAAWLTSLGGYFHETTETIPASAGIGGVMSNGTMIPANKIATKIPPVCAGG